MIRPGARGSLPHIRVLLVEDEDAHAELISRAFESQSDRMRLVVADTLGQARAAIEEAAPDIALIDMLLPDGNGIELLPPAGEATEYPIVIMTSHGDEERAVEAMKGGALDYVVKSTVKFAEMPQIVEGALREWGHIVERRRAEQKLQESEEHFRALIENAHDIITLVDEEGISHYVSPAIERILGYSPEERLGANFFELVHAEDRDAVMHKVLQASAEPGTTQFLAYRYRHRDGSMRIFEATGSLHQPIDSQHQRVVINSRDVTDRKQLEDQLRHSQKWEIIGTLAGGIANEFNNMLTPILGFASLALNEASPGSKGYKRLEHILTAANRSRDLAEQLLVFSRQSEPRRTPLQLHEIVTEVIKLLRPTLPPTIEIRKQIRAETDTVNADPEQMHQVLMNLCTNAHHAMSEGGVLEVDLDPVEVDAEFVRKHGRPHEGSYLRLIVRDTGHGMDRATKERVLEPFFTTKGAEQRSGLGLSITHGIVASHGGALIVESEPGEGTAVHVYLPLAEQVVAQ